MITGLYKEETLKFALLEVTTLVVVVPIPSLLIVVICTSLKVCPYAGNPPKQKRHSNPSRIGGRNFFIEGCSLRKYY
jgi:hypothetical protein